MPDQIEYVILMLGSKPAYDVYLLSITQIQFIVIHLFVIFHLSIAFIQEAMRSEEFSEKSAPDCEKLCFSARSPFWIFFVFCFDRQRYSIRTFIFRGVTILSNCHQHHLPDGAWL
jgi:hypothetical protein